jgi:hypothetical protein
MSTQVAYKIVTGKVTIERCVTNSRKSGPAKKGKKELVFSDVMGEYRRKNLPRQCSAEEAAFSLKFHQQSLAPDTHRSE